MQSAMDALAGFLERRRWLILGAWVALLLAAVPFAMRQTENLTSGGFSAPGSGSEAVDRAIEDFGDAFAGEEVGFEITDLKELLGDRTLGRGFCGGWCGGH